MAERIWSSPRLFLSLSGDRDAAKRLERKARTCVGYLFDQLRPGQTYRVQSWNWPDGTRIKAHVWRDVLGERSRVEILALPTEPPIFETKGEIPFENGLIALSHMGTPDVVPPQLYLSGSNVGYFTSHGTLLTEDCEIDEEKYGHVHSVILKVGEPGLERLELRPLREPLGTNYTSKLYIEDTRWLHLDDLDRVVTKTISSEYTGLMRLAVQAKLAKNLTPDILFPFGNDHPHDSGLIRTTDYKYFVVRITSSGCNACRMQTNPIYENVRQALIDCSYSEDDHDRLEALLLSTLKPAYVDEEQTQLDTYVLLTEEDGMVEDSATFVLAYGWKFAYPPMAEAAIVRYKVNFYETYPYNINECVDYESYLSKITFSLEKDIAEVWQITASIEHTYCGRWNLSGTNSSEKLMWLPKLVPYPRIEHLIEIFCGNPQYYEIDATIYCYYDHSGLQTVHYYDKQWSEPARHNPPLATRTTICEAVSTESILGVTGDLNCLSHGFYFNNDKSTLLEFLGERNEYYTDVAISGGDAFASPAWLTVYGYNLNSNDKITGEYCSGDDTPDWVSDHRYSWHHDYATVDVTATRRLIGRPVVGSYYVTPLQSALVIPLFNAEAAVSISLLAQNIGQSWNYFMDYADQYNFFTKNGVKETDYYHNPIDEYSGNAGFLVDGGTYNTSGSGGYSGFGWTSRYHLNASTTDTLGVEIAECRFLAKTSRNEINTTPPPNDWSIYFNNALLEDFITFSMYESWGGELRYPVSGGLQFPYTLDNYADLEEIDEFLTVRWAGWV